MRLMLLALVAVAVSLPQAPSARAADLFSGGGFPAMASDRQATSVGDSLLILVYENSLASNSTNVSSQKKSGLSGRIQRSRGADISGDISAGGSFEGGGEIGRSGKMLAQLSVIVDEVLPNGDLHVSGKQLLNVNGERTTISLAGRVRRVDIVDNTVVSSRLSDVAIDYDGSGVVARSSKPGFVTRFINWLGVL